MEKNIQEINPIKPKKKKLRKFILIFFGIIGAIALSLYFFPVILGFIVKDIPPIDDSDLRLQKVEIPNEQNAYYDLIKLQDKVLETSEPELEEIIDYLNLNKWEDQVVGEIIKNNEEALLIFDEALKKPYFQDPAFSDPEKISFGWVSVRMGSWRQTSRISALKSLYLMKQDKNQEALEEAIKSVKIGQKIQNSQAHLMGYLVAISMKDIGLEAIQKILSQSNNLESEFLINYSNQFDDFYKNEEGLIKTFKVEYLPSLSVIDLSIKDPKNAIPGDLSKKANNSFYFQPNKTKVFFAEYARLNINNVTKPCGLIKDNEIKTLIPSSSYTDYSMIKLYFTENAIGKLLHDIMAVSISGASYKKCQDDFIVGVTQTLIALKAYEIDNGNFPLSLNELTPKYLPKIPQDPFDGKDIKYSFDKKILYSVGEDMIDSGGSEGEFWSSMPNPTFKIEF